MIHRDVQDGPSDFRDDGPGAMKKHPKVGHLTTIDPVYSLMLKMLNYHVKNFVGFFSHAAFPDKDDTDRQTEYNEDPSISGAKQLLDQEYR